MIENNSAYEYLHQLWERSADWDVREADMLVDIWEGKLPIEYRKMFPEKYRMLTLNLIRKAWTDLSELLAPMPELRALPLNESDVESERTAKLEQIGYGYFDKAQPGKDLFLADVAWWLLGTNRAAVIVRPDFEESWPRMCAYDPRMVRVRYESSSNGRPIRLASMIVKHELRRDEAEERGFIEADGRGIDTAMGHNRVTVYEYVDETMWVLASQKTQMMEAHNLGCVPGWLFVVDKHGGSLFHDQIGLQAGASHLMAMKMASAERTVNPVYWVKNLLSQVKLGGAVVNELDDGGELGKLDPPAGFSVSQDIELIARHARIMNSNPAVRQGEVDTKGAYLSAKSVDELGSTLDTTLNVYRRVLADGYQKLMMICYKFDMELWNDEKQFINPLIRGNRKKLTYVPSEDIKDRLGLEVSWRFGVGGYQGFLQHIQALGAGVVTKASVIESMPGQKDARKVMQEITLERLDEAALASVMAQAESGALDLVLLGKIRERMATGGWTIWKAVEELQSEIEEQAQRAQETELGSVTAPPAGSPAVPPGPQGIPAGLFGGAAPEPGGLARRPTGGGPGALAGVI